MKTELLEYLPEKKIRTMHRSTYTSTSIHRYKLRKYSFVKQCLGIDDQNIMHEFYKGKKAIMCPHCYQITMINLTCNNTMEVTYDRCCDKEIYGWVLPRYFTESCSSCDFKGELIELDPNIAYSISKLNMLGYKTEFCCEGHDDGQGFSDPYIMFSATNQFQDLKDILYDLPLSWYIDTPINLKQGVIIRCDSVANDVDEAMLDLQSWVGSLPETHVGRNYGI